MTIVLCAVIGASLAWLVIEVLAAPEGYEDAEGFHPGREPYLIGARRGNPGGCAPASSFHGAEV